LDIFRVQTIIAEISQDHLFPATTDRQLQRNGIVSISKFI
jgi:hypothetical protein